jgi:hypothetical protein
LQNVPTFVLSPAEEALPPGAPVPGPTNQQLMDFMQQQFDNLNTNWDQRFVTLTTHVTSQVNALHTRLNDMQAQLNYTEEDAYYAR